MIKSRNKAIGLERAQKMGWINLEEGERENINKMS